MNILFAFLFSKINVRGNYAHLLTDWVFIPEPRLDRKLLLSEIIIAYDRLSRKGKFWSEVKIISKREVMNLPHIRGFRN